MARPRGYVLYEGPSLLDSAPIVVVAVTKSRNVKTANTIQTFILRADVDPLVANKSGADYSICGICPLRGTPTDDPARATAAGRRCYVVLVQAPLSVWSAYRRGADPMASDIAAVGAGRRIRLGTYGDPAAVPAAVWRALVSRAESWTGYSHQAMAGVIGAEYRPELTMRSVESLKDAQQAWVEGDRTFRVVQSVAEVSPAEVLCPASREGGYRTTCASCGLCAGSTVRAKSVAIVAHGAGASHFATVG